MPISYELSPAEILGFIGGVVLAIALAPQVFHTTKTRSTKDISYGWQLTYIAGLMLNYVYFVMIHATAAWITLTIELGFALWLLVMKIQIDGVGFHNGKKINIDAEIGCKVEDQCLNEVICVEGNVDLDLPVDTLQDKDAIKFRTDNAICAETLVTDAYRGFHIMVDVVFTIALHEEFGRILLSKMCELASIHGVRVVHDNCAVFDGDVSPPGFAAVALLDESHMSAHCYSDQGKLAFDVFTCGGDPDCTRRVARDVLAFVRRHVGEDAVFQIHRLPRFPEPTHFIPSHRAGCEV